MDDRVRPLVVTVKHWAKVSGITGARDHKLSGWWNTIQVLLIADNWALPSASEVGVNSNAILTLFSVVDQKKKKKKKTILV